MTIQDHIPAKLADAAFICFAGTTLVFSPNTSIFRGLSGGAFIGWFIYPMFIAMIVAACAVACVARRQAGMRPPQGVHLTCAALYVCASIGFGVFSLIGAEGGVLPALAGVTCGATFVPVCIAWARRLAQLDFKGALIASCVACIGAALLSSALTYVPGVAKMALYCACVLVGAFAPVLQPRQNAALLTEDTSKTANPSAGLLSMLRLPAAGLLLYAFMMAISKNQAFGLFDSEFVGGIVAALCIVPLVAVRSTGSLPSLVYRIIVPAMGGVAIVLFSLPADLGLTDVALTVVYIFLSALAILALANVIAVMHAGEFSCDMVVGAACAAGGAVSLAGLALANYAGPEASFTPAIFVMVALYVAFLLVSLGLDSWRMVTRPTDDPRTTAPAAPNTPNADNLSNAPEAPTQRPDALAWLTPEQAMLLSAREREILAYWCRGHSVIYIAEKLFISESTVRTHVKHIYAKLDIHSREELLEVASK